MSYVITKRSWVRTLLAKMPPKRMCFDVPDLAVIVHVLCRCRPDGLTVFVGVMLRARHRIVLVSSLWISSRGKSLNPIKMIIFSPLTALECAARFLGTVPDVLQTVQVKVFRSRAQRSLKNTNFSSSV